MDEMPKLPPLPKGGEFMQPPPCFPMGLVGWLLYTDKRVRISDYKCACRLGSA